MYSSVGFDKSFSLLTDEEKNLIIYSIMIIKKNNSLCVTLLVDEMINEFDFENQDVFDAMLEAVEGLYEKSFIISDCLRCRWILGYSYSKDKKHIHIDFSPMFNDMHIMKKKWSVYRKEFIE